MIISIGIDIVEKYRIKKIFLKYGFKFVKKILHNDEIKFFFIKKKKIEFLLKTFAVKEAYVKLLGTGIRNKIYFNKLCLINNKLGKPNFILSDFNILISLSHDKNLIIAVVFLFRKM